MSELIDLSIKSFELSVAFLIGIMALSESFNFLISLGEILLEETFATNLSRSPIFCKFAWVIA